MSAGRCGPKAGVRELPVLSRSSARVISFERRVWSTSKWRRTRATSVSGFSTSLSSRCSTSTLWFVRARQRPAAASSALRQVSFSLPMSDLRLVFIASSLYQTSKLNVHPEDDLRIVPGEVARLEPCAPPEHRPFGRAGGEHAAGYLLRPQDELEVEVELQAGQEPDEFRRGLEGRPRGEESLELRERQ